MRARRRAVDPTSTDTTALTIARLDAVLEAAAHGNLEPRVGSLADADPRITRLAGHLDQTLDVIDAFVRESAASLTAAAEGRHHREFLVRGMPGTFRDGATRINRARAVIEESAREITEQREVRSQLATSAVDASTQVASASTELGASAYSLAEAAGAAVDQVGAALDTMHSLESTSAAIQRAVDLIRQVASQTRMLALNATIEAARAGDAGRGFAVVATEVRSLADETATSSDDITSQVDAAQQAAAQASAAISAISSAIRDIDAQVEGISQAAGDLSGLAEVLSHDIGRFADIV